MSVVTYLYPVSGTVPPVASGTFSAVNAQITWADADTTITVTHNFALATAEVTAGFPFVAVVNDVTSVTGTAFPQALITKAANTLTLTKASAAGSGAVLDVQILRPNTMIR